MSTIDSSTILTTVRKAVEELRSEYPKARYIGSQVSIYSEALDGEANLSGSFTMSVHHAKLKHNCVVSSKPTIKECVTDIHTQLKEFVYLLK